MFALFKQINSLVVEANHLARAPTGGKPRWSVFFTTRSFVALTLAVLINVLQLAGFPVPDFLGQQLADTVVFVVTGLLGLWALLERLFGKTRIVWSRRQAEAAVQEADALSVALQNAVRSGR